MAKQTINIGTTANDGTGDPLRTAFDKVNSNFTELYNDDAGDVNSIIAGDGISVDTATGNVTITNTITNNNQLINGAGYVDGTGTANYISKWTDADTIGNSVIYDNGTNVGIGTSSPSAKLDVNGNGVFQSTSSTNDLEIRAGLAGATNGTASLTLRPLSSLTGTSYARAEITSISTAAGDAALILKTTTDSSGAQERMRIDSSGNVGIGTSSPLAKLDVQGDVIFNDPSASLSVKSSSVGGVYNIMDSATGVHSLQFDGGYYSIYDLAAASERMRIDSSGNVTINGTDNRPLEITSFNTSSTGAGWDLNAASVNGVVSISTAGSERMRIDSSGNVGIGTSSIGTQGKLYIVANGISEDVKIGLSPTNSSGGPNPLAQIGATANGTYGSELYFTTRSTGGTVFERMRLQSDGDLHVDGDVIAYSTTISDERLKDDVQTIDNALDKVSNLRGVSYTWNNGNRKGQKDLGLIAQEVEQVLPELVREKEMPMIDGGTYKTVDYEKIVGVLIEAVKELTEKVNKLEAK